MWSKLLFSVLTEVFHRMLQFAHFRRTKPTVDQPVRCRLNRSCWLKQLGNIANTAFAKLQLTEHVNPQHIDRC